jgi:hypothetical protein
MATNKKRKQTGPPGTPLEVAEAQRSFKGKWFRFDEWVEGEGGASGISRSGRYGSNSTVASSDFGKLERIMDRQRRRIK